MRANPDGEPFPALRLLFGAYFHQDWDADDPDDAAVVRRFVRDDGPMVGRQLDEELGLLLGAGLTDAELGQRLAAFGCYFDPPGIGLSNTAWLRRLRDVVREVDQPGKAGGPGGGMLS